MDDAREPIQIKPSGRTDLARLAEVALRGSYPEIARWVMEYRYEQLLQQENTYLENLRCRYRELLNSYSRHWLIYEGHRRQEDYAYYRSLESLQAISAKMLHLLDDGEVDKAYLQDLLERNEFGLVRNILSSLKPNRSPTENILSYERRLYGSHVFLLEELVAILTREYDQRILETRQRFERFLIPHQRAIDAIGEEIRAIDSDLNSLSRETLLEEEERSKILAAFLQKKDELEDLLYSETGKMLKIQLISRSVKDSVSRFRDLIANLQRALDAHKIRRGYIEKLARLGARVPDLRNLLDSLYDTFQREVGGLDRDLHIFDPSFQEMVFKAVDEQGIVNRILDAPHGLVKTELAILEILREAPTRRERIRAELVRPDLSFLNRYNETALVDKE